MHISLKKQIHDKKISTILKLHDIVLFFTIFHLPQKKRQYLKSQVAENITHFPPHQLYISNKCAKHVLEKYIFETHLHTKSLEEIPPIVSASMENLPLYGQTLLIACRREEQAKELYKYTTSLYNTSLLGGFYKNSCKTREFLKAVLNAASNKVEIYKEFLKVLSMVNYKFVQTTVTPNGKLLILLKKTPVCATPTFAVQAVRQSLRKQRHAFALLTLHSK